VIVIALEVEVWMEGGGTNIGSFGEGAPDGIPAAQTIIPAEPLCRHNGHDFMVNDLLLVCFFRKGF
jgi:hypothetical protein